MPELTSSQVDQAIASAKVQQAIEACVTSLKQSGQIPYFATRVGRPQIKRGEPGQLDIIIRFNTGQQVTLVAEAGEPEA